MSKKFYAVNRETGDKWKSKGSYKQYLIMYDSGYLGVVDKSDPYYMSITPLDPKIWKRVIKQNMKRIINE